MILYVGIDHWCSMDLNNNLIIHTSLLTLAMELSSDVARISNQGLQVGLKSPGGACTSLNKVCYYVKMYLDSQAIHV